MGFPLVFGLIEEKTLLQNELWSLQKVPFKNYFFIDFFTKNQTFQKRAQRIANNVLRLCEEADFGALNCQHTTKFDAR